MSSLAANQTRDLLTRAPGYFLDVAEVRIVQSDIYPSEIGASGGYLQTRADRLWEARTSTCLRGPLAHPNIDHSPSTPYMPARVLV